MNRSFPEIFRDFCWRFASVFFALYIATVSFDYYIFPNVMNWMDGPFQQAASFSGKLFFGIDVSNRHEFYSDSILNYLHVFNCIALAFIGAAIWTYFAKRSFTSSPLWPFAFTVVRYFLALHLFMYGFSKIYKWQFMYPEPNLLYQTVGQTPRDMLYWTSMGTSYTYCVFMGLIEVIPAVLLLFRRTALIGALISFPVLCNVVMVNLGFDITVKIHSITLLLMSLFLILPMRKELFRFFRGRGTTSWEYPAWQWPKKKWLSRSLKIVSVILLLAESNYPYFETENFNDDKAERIPMHGAYEITYTHYSTNADGPVFADDDPANTPERFFIHRRGYFIVQMQDESMHDYSFTMDTTNHKLVLDFPAEKEFYPELIWQQTNDSTYTFTGDFYSGTIEWTTRKLDLSKLPLLQEEFGWVDEE